MATNQTYTSTIFVNAEQAVNTLNDLTNRVKDLRQQSQKALISGDAKTFKETNRQIKEVERQMKGLRTTAQQIDHVLANLSTAAPNDIKNTIRAINKELDSGSVPRGTKQWDYFQQKLRECKTELRGIQAESQAASKGGFISKTADILNKNWGAITQAWAAFTGLSQTVRQTTQAYADMEEAMANVRKYTGQTDEEIHAMNEEFKQIDTRTSREQLNELAGAAGRLGIQSHDEIMEFVDAADKINVALGDDLGDGAVDQIGKLAMAFGEDETLGLRGAMLATGSAINELSANSSANAGYMVDFAARLAGVGKQAGLTQTQLYGLGSVMDENLLQDEMSSTALSQLITKMITDTETFAKMAGVPLQEFSDMVKNDMNSALLTFFDAMKQKGGFTELAPMFEEMGLSGQRATAVLSVFADKVDDVRKNQQVANDAYREATSVMDEYNVQNNTVQAGVDKAKKRFNDLCVELGERLLPIVKYTINGGSLLVKALSTITSFVTRHITLLTGLAVVIGTYTVAMKIANAQDKISLAYQTALSAIKTAHTIATNRLARSMTLAAMRQKILNATVRAFPGTWLATAVAAVAVGFVSWQKRMADTDRYARELREHVAGLKKETDAQKQSIKELLPVAQDESRTTQERRDAIEKLRAILPDYFKDLDTETARHYEVAEAMDAVNEKLREKLLIMARDAQAEYEAAKANYGKNDNGAVMPGATGTQWARQSELSELEALRKKAEAARKAEEDLNRELFASQGGMSFTKPDDAHNTSGKSGSYGGHTTKTNNTTTTNTKDDPMKTALDQTKKQAEQQLMVETNRYDAGLINLKEYTEKQKDINLTAMDEQLRIMRQCGKTETDEYKELQQQRQAEQIKDDNKLRDISIEGLERQHQAQEALIKAQLTDRTSELYGNEEAMDEALFQNDMAYLQKKRDMYEKTSDEYAATDAEIQQQLNDHKLEKERQYHERLQQMKDEYLTVDESALMQRELDMLNEFHAAGELSEEEYQQALMAIREKYAKREPTAGERTRQTAQSSLSAAEKMAGDAPQHDTGDADMGVGSFAGIFRIVEYRRQVNEQLKALYGEDYENSEEYNEAKRQNNALMLQEIVNAASAAYQGINSIMSAASAYSQACSDLETAKIEASYEKQIKAAGNNSKKKEKLENERDKKVAAAKTKANKKAMAMEIAQAIAQTAMSAISAYSSTMAGAPYPSNLVLAPISAAIATAAGMLQIATIKKQHQAEQAGYYSGGFTGGTSYRRQAGVVHEGEFVANHYAVSNPALLPALQLIDQAQRSNTVAALTGEDVSRAVGGGGAAVVAPVVNVQTDTEGQERMRRTIAGLNDTVAELQRQLAEGITAIAAIDGQNGVANQLKRYNRLMKNK